LSGLQSGNRNAPKWGKAICKEADVKFYAEVFSMPLAGGVLLREKAIEKAAGVMGDAAVDAVKAPRTGASQKKEIWVGPEQREDGLGDRAAGSDPARLLMSHGHLFRMR
jgi:hypothetical protein